MTIHKEGYPTLLISIVVLSGINIGVYHTTQNLPFIFWAVFAISVVLFGIVLQFFRFPSRQLTVNDKQVICPADGKVVVIEETTETEYFNDKRIQVSVFMSPFNVHINWFPIGGVVKFFKYHPGKFLVAWHPKSSTENERTTYVVENGDKVQVLFRQIAGALARRIVAYGKEGDVAKQGTQFGFIKFGSRVDIYLPIGTKLNVQIDQKVQGGVTVLAEL